MVRHFGGLCNLPFRARRRKEHLEALRDNIICHWHEPVYCNIIRPFSDLLCVCVCVFNSLRLTVRWEYQHECEWRSIR